MSLIKNTPKINKKIAQNLDRDNANSFIDELISEMGNGVINTAPHSEQRGETRNQPEIQKISKSIENELKLNEISIFEYIANNKNASEKLSLLPSNKEYFFLSELKTKELSIKSEDDLLKLGKKYNLHKNDIDNLIVNKLLIPHTNFKDNSSKLKNGFISKISYKEELFLKKLIKDSPKSEDTEQFKKIQTSFGIDGKSLNRLKNNGHLFILNSKEIEWVNSGMKNSNSNDFEINRFRMEEIAGHLQTNHSIISVKSCPIRHKNYVVNYSESDCLLSYRATNKLDYQILKDSNDVIAVLSYEKNALSSNQRIKDKYYELRSAGLALTEQDKSDIMTILISDSPVKYMSESKIKNLKPLVENTFDPKIFNGELIPNNSFFFLMNLKEHEKSEDFSIESFSKKFNITEGELAKFRHEKIIVSEEMSDDLDKLISKGLVYKTNTNEEQFLQHMNKENVLSDSDDLQLAIDKFNLQLSDYQRLKKNGFISIINQNEDNWLREGANLKAINQYEIAEQRAKQIIARHLINGKIKRSVVKTGIKKIRNYKINYNECDELIRLRSLNKINTSFSPKESDSKLILKVFDNGIETLNQFEKNRYFELLTNGKGLPVQDYADVLALEMNDFYEDQFSESRRSYIALVQNALKEQDPNKYKNYRLNLNNILISNNEYFFLSHLRTLEYRGISKDKIIEIGTQEYGLTQDQVKKLEENRFFEIDLKDGSMSKKERKFKGFISIPSEMEINFLNKITDKQCFLESADFNKIKEECRIDDTSLNKLISNKHLLIVTEKQFELLKKGISIQEWEKQGHNKFTYYSYNKKLKNNETLLPSYIETGAISSKKLVVNYKERDAVLQYRHFLPSTYKLKNKATDTSLLVTAELDGLGKLSLMEKERYYELMAHEVHLKRENIPSIDEVMFLKKLDGKEMHTQKGVCTIDYLRTQDFIKNTIVLDLKQMKEYTEPKKIIKSGRIEHFKNIGLITSKQIDVKDGIKSIYETHWKEPKSLSDARIYFTNQNIDHTIQRFDNYLSDLKNVFGADANSKYEKIKDLLGNKSIDSGIISPNKFEVQSDSLKKLKLIDYEIYVKQNLGGILNSKEQERLLELRLYGLDPKMEVNRDKYLESNPSFRMKRAQNIAFNKKYVELTGLNTDHIKFINSFKQVSESDLIRIGMSKDLINRLKEGTNCKALGNRIEILKSEQAIYENREAVNYYSIQHLGVVSGRSILETFYPDLKIEKQSQNRKDLINHDLKVVTCVLNIKEELEKEGHIVKEIKNESTQYSENKLGLSNDKRVGGPSYMDAIIIIEAQDTLNQGSGGSSSKTIAVEYGNYSTARMQSKIENADFDEAYIFANNQYVQKYQNKITTNKIVHYRTL